MPTEKTITGRIQYKGFTIITLLDSLGKFHWHLHDDSENYVVASGPPEPEYGHDTEESAKKAARLQVARMKQRGY